MGITLLGDSIPMHLVTREAMALYVKHLSPTRYRLPGDQPFIDCCRW